MDSLTFIGTATTVLRLGSFTLLTDPNFLHRGQRAYLGKGLWSKRLTEPAMSIEELPELDAVVLSHLHGDHFDRVARRDLARSQPVLTTPAAARRLGRGGSRPTGLETWQSETLTRGNETLTVTSLPAIHARGLMGALLPPVMGSMLEHRSGGESRRRVYISGDTLTGEHIREIAREVRRDRHGRRTPRRHAGAAAHGDDGRRPGSRLPPPGAAGARRSRSTTTTTACSAPRCQPSSRRPGRRASPKVWSGSSGARRLSSGRVALHEPHATERPLSKSVRTTDLRESAEGFRRPQAARLRGDPNMGGNVSYNQSPCSSGGRPDFRAVGPGTKGCPMSGLGAQIIVLAPNFNSDGIVAVGRQEHHPRSCCCSSASASSPVLARAR